MQQGVEAREGCLFFFNADLHLSVNVLSLSRRYRSESGICETPAAQSFQADDVFESWPARRRGSNS